MIEQRYSRPAFDRASDVADLSTALEALLHRRLEGAADRAAEVERIIADLRTVGHDLWSWDESGSAAVWGGDYVRRPYDKRLVLRVVYDEPGGVEVEVHYGPWPSVT